MIPYRSDQWRQSRHSSGLDTAAYRRRNVVERCVGWLKELRRIATRYEKLALNYLAFVKLAMIRRCLRNFDFSDRA